MGNPTPVQTREFKERQYKARGDIPGNQPLSKKPTSIKLPVDIDDAIRSLPEEERVPWLRRVICDAARAELLQSEN